MVLAVDAGDEDAGAGRRRRGPRPRCPTITVRYSATEVLRHKDFAAYSHDEFAEARRLMADLRLAGELRRSRRLRPARRAPGRPDLRRTVRRALRSGGEPIRRAWLAPAERPRRVVLLCDVSGSMEPYARALLRFLHAAVTARGAGRVEAFALGHPADPDHPGAVAGATPTPPWPTPPRRSPTGRAAPGWATACGSSTTAGACGAWPGARSW